jgi:hypothetical protein
VLKGDGTLGRGGDEWLRFLDRLGQDPRERYALVARNFLLDEGVVPERMESYGELNCLGEHADAAEWKGLHEGYLAERVFRPPDGPGLPRSIDPTDEDGCPESFRLFDASSDFPKADRKLHLIRVEQADFIAQKSSVPVSEIMSLAQEVVASPGSAAAQRLNDVLSKWARNVDLRPRFAAFLDDVIDLFGATPDADPPGWADTLRDSLGLALVPPTVLDSFFSDAFFPAPRRAKTGHVVHLGGD